MNTYRSALIALALLLSCIQAIALTSLEITEKTLAALPQCLHYQVKGLCYWLSPAGMTLTTPYVSHYLPDVVVNVFNPPSDHKGGNAWSEIGAVLDLEAAWTQKQIISAVAHVKAGGGGHDLNASQEAGVFFKEVDVIGNPTLMALPNHLALLPSIATALKPYFQSMLDTLLWRGFAPYALAQQADAVLQNTTHYIGSKDGIIRWSGLFPYEGKVVSHNETKAAAVVALRATHLLTAPNRFGHLYQGLPTQCGVQCTAAAVQENNDDSLFQLIYPHSQSRCQVFGQTTDYGDGWESKAQGRYVWVLWRKYQGCIKAAGQYLGHTLIH